MDNSTFYALKLQIVLPVLGFVLIAFLTAPYFKGPPEICEVSALNVEVNDQPVEDEDVAGDIVVHPGDSVTVKTSIEPEGCRGNLSIRWSLPFTDSTSEVQIISKAMAYEEFTVTLIDTKVPDEYPEKTVKTILGVSSNGNEVEQQILTFDVGGK